MPRAVIDTTPERFDLETCPGGYVELRRMPYAAWLHRTDISMQMSMEFEEPGAGNRAARRRAQRERSKGTGGGDTQKLTTVLMNEAVTVYEFSQCIVGHNLEDANGEPLNLNQPSGLRMLDPRIGDEISQYIKDLHEFSEDEEGNS